jgi:outer membrane biosynthesis protein TonB
VRCTRTNIGAALAASFIAGCAPTPAPAPAPTPVPARPAPELATRAPAAKAPKSLAELRVHAAQRIRAVNGERCYDGEVPDMLLAIPVLEVELNADGSVRRIQVLRKPSNPQAHDTIKLATDAVHRAAPYGDVSKLPKPWKFTETFLFTEDRKFKLRTLDG